MAQDRWTLQREKELAGSQAAQPQSLAHKMQVTGKVAGCSHAVQDLPPFKMNAANTTAHELRKRSLRVGSSNTHNEQCMDGWMDTNTVHGPPMQSRDAAAYRAVPAARAMV